MLIAELVETLAPATAHEQRELSFIGLGASTSESPARDADDLLADSFGRD